MTDRDTHQIIACTLALITATTLATACSNLPAAQSQSSSGETVASSSAASSASSLSAGQTNAPGASDQSPKADFGIEAGGSELTIRTSSPNQAEENAAASPANEATTSQSPQRDGQASVESGTSQGAGNSSESATAPRTWVVDYQEVWVPDIVEVVVEPERTETAYEWRDVLMCNVSGCGFSTESSGEMASHWGQHALNGVDEGYSSVPRQVPAGTQFIPTVTRQEDHGHYELIETGGHWE